MMPTWAAALVVAGATTIIGAIMVFAGKSKVQARSFATTRTVDSIAKDEQTIRRQMQ